MERHFHFELYTNRDYRRGWEACLNEIYYRLFKARIRDPKIHRIMREMYEAISKIRESEGGNKVL